MSVTKKSFHSWWKKVLLESFILSLYISTFLDILRPQYYINNKRHSTTRSERAAKKGRKKKYHERQTCVYTFLCIKKICVYRASHWREKKFLKILETQIACHINIFLFKKKFVVQSQNSQSHTIALNAVWHIHKYIASRKNWEKKKHFLYKFTHTYTNTHSTFNIARFFHFSIFSSYSDFMFFLFSTSFTLYMFFIFFFSFFILCDATS